MSNVDGSPLTVYVVDDDTAVLKSLCALLLAHGYQAIACQSAEEFLSVHDADAKACMLLDLRMPGMSGLELQAHLNDLGAKIPIIVVTGHGDVPVAVRAMKAGAIDFIEKPTPEDQLLTSLAMANEILDGRITRAVPAELVSVRLGKLTEREREVLDLLVVGKINKEIAEQLGVSQRTVEIHRARVREKMGARGIADLIRMLS